MKKYLKFLTYCLMASFVVLASCGGDDDDDDNDDSSPDPVDEIVERLTGGETATWVLNEGGATLESVAVEEWNGMTITISGDATGLSYTTNGSADLSVWPNSGTWTFVEGQDGRSVTRDDNIELDITASETSLTLGFDIAEGRTNGIVGRWSFSFTRQ